MTELEKRISVVASRMTLREPFIAAIFTKLDREYGKTGTAATNGKRFYFGEEYCDKLTDDELLFVCMHEAMHVIYMHMWRRSGRNPMLWNIATDAVINATLRNLSYAMPQGGILIDWVRESMDAEDVYKRLMEQSQGQGQDKGQTVEVDENGVQHSGGGGWDDTGDLEDAQDQADAADMEATITTAARMAKACGRGSALIDRILGGALAPSVKWSDVLRHVMTASARNDYTYQRFNRRHLANGLYLPALHSDSMGGLVIGVDTSGSVSDRELTQIAAEITAIAEDCRPDFVEVVYIDSEIKSIQRFDQGDPVELKPKGGGGTRFAPLFTHILEKNERVAATLYLTDLAGDVDECDDPGIPVIWGVTDRRKRNAQVPFGQIVEVVV